MLKISIISVFPHLHQSFIETSLVARARKNGRVAFKMYAFSDFCEPGERIDTGIAGHGPGMLIKSSVVEKAIEAAEAEWGRAYRLFFSPQGTLLTQDLLKNLMRQCMQSSNQVDNVSMISTHSFETHESFKNSDPHILLVCSRYEGIDCRVEQQYADLLLSIGDYVLMGGEVAANVFLEAFLRLIPGVVGNTDSVEQDSFEQGLLDYPSYALPTIWKDQEMPAVIRSGNHGALQEWRETAALQKTMTRRFDLIKKYGLAKKYRLQALAAIPAHYLVLMHGEVLVKNGDVGTTSIGSLNFHDICRAARTYGIKKVFIVTPLEDQHQIIATFLHFWNGTSGQSYNAARSSAISLLVPLRSFDEVKKAIAQEEGVDPLILTTSAKVYEHAPSIDYQSQNQVWDQKKPILLVFGTGQGLAPHIMDQSSYILKPVFGMTDFNHLSVRSAIAIILDRWLGF